MNKKNAILLFGGKSFEHDISIITALIIYRNARHTNFNLMPVYVDRNNEWFFYAGDNLKNEMFKDFNLNYKSNGFKKIYFKFGNKAFFFKEFLKEKKIDIDVCLNCCHGGDGEDGLFVNFLNLYGIPCSSQNPVSLGICMDKNLTKIFARSLKIPVVKFIYLTKSEYLSNKESVLDRVECLKFPLIIKPANLGSSIGIEVVHTIDEFEDKLMVSFEFDTCVIIEKAIINDMKEYNIACVKVNDEIKISQIDKPIKSDEILSFKDKYIGSAKNISNTDLKSSYTISSPSKKQNAGQYLTKKNFDVNIDDNIRKDITKYAEIIYKNLNLSGIVRIDFICEKNKVYLNEINAIPGSLAYYFFVPYCFKTLSHFIDAMLNQCIIDFNKKNQINKKFITNLF